MAEPAETQMTSSSPDNTTDEIKKKEEVELGKRDAKRASFFRRIEILILVAVAIAYIIYGAIKIQQAKDTPDTKISEKEVTPYTLPGVIGCIVEDDPSTDYFEISEIYIDGERACGTNFTCNVTDPDIDCTPFTGTACTSLFKTTYDPSSTTVTISNGTYVDVDNDTLSCLLILPPTSKTFTKKYTVKFVYRQEGMTDTDATFKEYYNFSLPQFLVDQKTYSIVHWTFHMDEILEYADNPDSVNISLLFNEDLGDDLVLNPVDYIGTTTFVAGAFTDNQVDISLYTTKYVDGTKDNTYYSQDAGTRIDDHELQVDGTDIYSVISNTYYPTQVGKEKQKGTYYQHYTEEYYSYTSADLLSGLGGIVSGAQGLIEIFLGFFLFGLSIKWLLDWSGYAPAPEFDEAEEIKLTRFLYKKGVVMKN